MARSRGGDNRVTDVPLEAESGAGEFSGWKVATDAAPEGPSVTLSGSTIVIAGPDEFGP